MERGSSPVHLGQRWGRASPCQCELTRLQVALTSWRCLLCCGPARPSHNRHPRLCSCHPVLTVPFCQERQRRTKKKYPRGKRPPTSLDCGTWASRAADWLEKARIVHILDSPYRWAQVRSGGASILSLHLWGREAPVTGRQTDPLLSSSCMRCHIKCFLRRAWGLGLWVRLSTDLRERNEPVSQTEATATNVSFSYSWMAQLRLASHSVTSRRQQEVEIDHFLPSLPSANLGFRTH